MKLGTRRRDGFAGTVQTDHDEDDLRGYRMVQALAVFIAAGAFWSAYLMSRSGLQAYLGHGPDPDLATVDVTVGAWVGIPTALAGAVVSYLAAYERRWGLVRICATLLLAANLLVPLVWTVCWFLKTGPVRA